MSHRVHPKIFRIKGLSDWDSRWFEKNLPQSLQEDFTIRKFLKKKLSKIGLEKIEIEKFPGKINIIISSSRPGLIIGRGGEGIESLRKELSKIINNKSFSEKNKKDKKDKKEIKIEVKEIKNPWLSASFAAQWIAQQIEKRLPYRKVLKQTLEKISNQKGVEGCRIEVSGRLNGAEIARRDWLKKGRLPRQSLRADIDYAQAEAFCTYGVIGVKVWIYKGEKFS